MVQSSGFRLVAEPGNVPPGPQNFPQQLQIRFNGVDLGGPDFFIIDFVGAFNVVRGTGVDSGKITVTMT